MQTKEQFINSLVKKEDKVKEALVKLYQGVRATNEFLGLKNSQELQSTYYQLRVEEISELFTAIENQDKVEFLDAIVDGLVVVGYEVLLKTEKPSENAITIRDSGEIKHIISSLYTNFKKTDEAVCGNCLFLLENIFSKLDVDHVKATNEVLESNLSKFPTKYKLKEAFKDWWDDWENDIDITTIIGWQIEEIENQDRYIGVHHEIRVDNEGNERIIFWADGEKQSDGSIKEFKAPKYVKPCTFREPDFAGCWLN